MQKIKQQLKNKLGQATFENWFKNTYFGNDDSRVHCYTHSQFTKDWITTHYLDDIYSALLDVLGHKNIQICMQIEDMSAIQQRLQHQQIIEQPEEDDAKHTFSNFIVGKTNELAYTAAMKVCETIHKPDFNPLFIYGEPGVGKSHLLSAISHEVKKTHPNLIIKHMTAETFMYSFVKALRERDVMSFKDELRSTQLLLIDDVHFMMGKDSTQEEFFHTFNYLKERGCQMVLSSDKAPSQLSGIEERLKSRLGWGLSQN